MSDRTAIITGGSKRVGARIVRALLEDGWIVAAQVRSVSDEVPEGVTKVIADLSQLESANAIFAAASKLPPVRLLVNNAARFAHDAFGQFSAAEFDSHMAVNVRAPLMMIEELAARHLGGDACVINILDAKLTAPNADFLSYTLSKHALGGLTELAARALAPAGIRVNAIAPALMLLSKGQSHANYARMHARNPLGRGVEPDDVIAAIRYLAGAAKVTGEIITIDSGQRFMALERDVQFLEDE